MITHSASKLFDEAVEEISQLPGIGNRTALRLALHLLDIPTSNTDRLVHSLYNLVHKIKHCKYCNNLSDEEICKICSNSQRNSSILCIVEDVRDVMAIENTGEFYGKYHVLGGLISPIQGVGPSDLFISTLLKRINEEEVKEIIFALSATIEGDTTIFYIYKLLKDISIQFTTIARGIGIGEELEYIDELTLGRSLQNRIPYQVKL